MKKLLFAISILGIGAVSFGALQRAASSARTTRRSRSLQWVAATNRLAQLTAVLNGLRAETEEKKRFLTSASSFSQVRPDLLKLMQEPWNQPLAALADLRRELGIGWNSSDDYVLVNKSVLKAINLHAFTYAPGLTDPARGILAISRQEESQIGNIIHDVLQEQSVRAQRTEPAGDIVAHYLIPADEPGLEQSISNRFSTEIIGVLGAQRADIFVKSGWPQLRSDLPLVGQEPVSLTVKRSIVNGEPRLVWQKQQAQATSSGPVRYAEYPANWFTRLFPRGWRELAEREHFDLPTNFETHR